MDSETEALSLPLEHSEALGPAESTTSETDAEQLDNLIPDPPDRPSRTRKVRLIKRGKDRPQPAEDPWA